MKTLQISFVLITAVVGSLALGGTQAHAQQLEPTFIAVQNSSTTARNLLSTNTTGVLNPSPNNPLNAGQTTNFTSTSFGSSDAGVVTYSGCRFNWSKIRQTNNTYTFSRGATPSGSCTATLVSSNTTTGAYSVRFRIN